jgi:hypothetical protein
MLGERASLKIVVLRQIIHSHHGLHVSLGLYALKLIKFLDHCQSWFIPLPEFLGKNFLPWNDHNQGRALQYTDVRSTWGGREGSYNEDHYPYAWRDVVDDTVHEEDF